MSDIEELDLGNVLELNKIRDILKPTPVLLNFFEEIVLVANKKLNEEAKPKATEESEDELDPDWMVLESDTDSD